MASARQLGHSHSHSPPRQPGRHSLAYIVLAFGLVLLVVLAYRPAWSGGFVWDDDVYITNNPLLVVPGGLERIWFSLDSPSQYFPLTYTVFRLERMAWDLRPIGYHLVNILLHSANALILWRLLSRLKIPGAFIAASVWALHPVQVESVAWMTELKNVLMGFFFLLALLTINRFLDEPTRPRWSWYGLSLILFALALSAKATACTLPVALIVLLLIKQRPLDVRTGVQILPFVVLALAMGSLSIWWERYHQGTHGTLFSLQPMERLLVASHAVWFYLGKLIWPARLSFMYPQWQVQVANPAHYIWLAALVLGAAVLCRLPPLLRHSVGWAAFFYVGTLGPMLGFIMLYTFRYTYVADHYQYLASIGPTALLCTGLVQFAEESRFYHHFVRGGAVLVIAVLTALTWRQSGNYRDSKTLWEATLATNPQSWMAYNNVGIDLFASGRIDEAIAQYKHSLQLHDDYAQAHYNLANALLLKGQNAEAVAQCRIALQLDPNDSDAHISLGNALLAAGRLTEALSAYAQACQLNPESADAQYNFGHALQEQGETAQAESRYRRALQLNPSLVEAHLNLGKILWVTGRQAEAVMHYEEAVSADPGSALAKLNLAWALSSASDSSHRDGARAVKLALDGGADKTGDAQALRILAAAYAEDRQFDNAVTAISRALVRASSGAAVEVVPEIQRELKLYQEKSSYQETSDTTQ